VLGFVANGDMTTALTLVMQRHGTAVYSYCREGLRDEALAEDVQQQVFVHAFRDLPKFRGRARLRTWLLAIAHHRMLDAVKSRSRAQAHLEDDDPAAVADPRPPASESIDEKRLHAALLHCLEELDGRQRSVLLLRYQQELTFEEMAYVCRKKPGTLQAQVNRALPRLKKCIEAQTGGSL
jgi:RNA polymerase sigma-70 factor, ECF subfamily